jgi:hypothetical protein
MATLGPHPAIAEQRCQLVYQVRAANSGFAIDQPRENANQGIQNLYVSHGL